MLVWHSAPAVNAKIAEAMFKKFTSAEKAKQLALQAETKARSLSLLYWYLLVQKYKYWCTASRNKGTLTLLALLAQKYKY